MSLKMRIALEGEERDPSPIGKRTRGGPSGTGVGRSGRVSWGESQGGPGGPY